MKFGEYLLQQQFTPWGTEYLQYDRIKKVIRDTNDGKIINQWLQTEFIKIKNFLSRQIHAIQYQLQLMEHQQQQQSSSIISLSGQLGDDLVYPLYDLHDLVRYLDLSLAGFKKLSKSHSKRQQACFTGGDDDGVANNAFMIIKKLDQYYTPLNRLLVRMAHIKNNRARNGNNKKRMKGLPRPAHIPSPSPPPPPLRDLGRSPLPPLPLYNDNDDGQRVMTSYYWVHPDHVFELKTLLLIYATLDHHHPLSTVYLDNTQWSVYNSHLNGQTQSTDSIECTWPGFYHAPNGNIQVNHIVYQDDNNVTSTKRHILPWASLNSCLRDLQRTSPLPPAKDLAGIRISTANTRTGNDDLAAATALIVEPRSKVDAGDQQQQQQQQLDQTLCERVQQQHWQPMATCTCERTTFTPTTTTTADDSNTIEIHVDTNIIMKEADRSFEQQQQQQQRQGGTGGSRHRQTGLSMMTVIQHFKKNGDTNMLRRKMEQRHNLSLGKATPPPAPDVNILKQLPHRQAAARPKRSEWPEWLKQLTHACDWIHAVPRFSMHVHLVSRLYGDHVPLLPWWLGYFDRSWLLASARGMNNCSYGLSRSIGLQPLLHGTAVSSLLTHPIKVVRTRQNHTTVDMDNDDDDDNDDMDCGKEKDLNMLLPKSTTPNNIATTTITTITPSAMTTSAKSAISNMIKKTTKPRWTTTATTMTTTTTTTGNKKMKVEPKVFFANERTFLSWLQFCALLLTVSLNMINFGGKDDPISRLCGGMFIIVTILMALYALAKYEFRAWNLLTRSSRYRFDDVYGPAILCLLLVVAMLINFGLRLNSPSSGGRQQSSSE